MASKYTQLAQRLIARQKQAKLDWKQTETEGQFQVSFPDYSVRISLHENRWGDDFTRVSIINEEGVEIDTFSDFSLKDEWPESNEQMLQLYNAARRAALGVEQALDTLLKELGD